MDMDKTYQPENFESKIYQTWEEQGFFKPNGDTTKSAFSIALPPPNVTGSLHIHLMAMWYRPRWYRHPNGGRAQVSSRRRLNPS